MKDSIIEKIVKEEWNQCQLVNNEGGRATCQDDWEQFHIMRKSQFLSWSENIINSYYDDLSIAKKGHRNLIFEKYAWMMESTSPEQFIKIRYALPFISEDRKQRINRAAAIQAKWGEGFAGKYPNIAGKGRAIYSSEDTPYSTSMETYARGEMLSYSENTEKMFSVFVLSNEEKGINLTSIVRENMVRLYGYNSLEQFEENQRSSNGIK